MSKNGLRAKTSMCSCENASILVWCRKRQYFCPYFAGIQCDDYKQGEPRRVYQELLIFGPKGDEDELNTLR